ncbi:MULTISPECIES: SLC13 family permease [unclassified Brevundimonas]|uniref:SLC13 family permease n=1 Tax=unclassified Brevundimonas TaxID=2622653 RepID=UPI000CFE2846|nr:MULTISPECIES: SLC13 family permease [unclassified Brevundimonas]PRA36552.1 carboxylate transporter [Brevundimonas sp. MYb27]PQZ78634.1 carboxylate transporter [Brevundimonas sp. MYb31]PRB13588.1 carboxylate transporter [Brevundimonas sp. MYb52]PRB34196.1 carboxylate transporter [Brevundimonas sp. MYb46]PRB46590.1 carboxylate transporter [Brevundimonas sp. MYb33]
MTLDQIIALIVLVAVVGLMIHGRMRSDVVALSGAAALLLLGVVRPVEVQSAFASPAVIALAGLFVIAYAIELSGLLGLMIRKATALCQRFGAVGIWAVIGLCGSVGGFLNNTPVVVLAAPVVRDMAKSLKLSPKRFLMPLSHVTVLGGLLTLIGTSTNLLVNDMARNAGQPVFSLFEITPVGLVIALVGGLWLYFFGARQLGRTASLDEEAEAERERIEAEARAQAEAQAAARQTRLGRWRLPFALPSLSGFGESRNQRDGTGDAHLGDVDLYASADRPLQWRRALIALTVFVLVVAAAGLGIAPIAAAAFAGAVALILLGVLTPDEAYSGLKPDILLLIAGMVVVGTAIEVTGLAAQGAGLLIEVIRPFGPLGALIVLYGVTLFATELLSNATVAVLVTPIAVALAESLGVDPRPFLVAVMMAASAAFATPFGYQTNVLVYQMGGYSYLDFVRVGLPLNLITWAAAMVAIPIFFPF